jgi:tetratricopeptide (TPR) repeat protein
MKRLPFTKNEFTQRAFGNVIKLNSGRGLLMFKQLFAVMNEILDEIITDYPTAVGEHKNQLAENLNVLKDMSDKYIEEWLAFEEKLGKLYGKHPLTEKKMEPEEYHSEAYGKGQGYFKLSMFEHAVQEFEKVVEHQPDFSLARLFMALCYYQMGSQDEAYRHFQWITSLSEDLKIKAICYHNMGCIQAKMQNMDKASEYFEMAYETDPSASFYSLS